MYVCHGCYNVCEETSLSEYSEPDNSFTEKMCNECQSTDVVPLTIDWGLKILEEIKKSNPSLNGKVEALEYLLEDHLYCGRQMNDV